MPVVLSTIAPPPGATATADHTNGWFTVTWTNSAGFATYPDYNRVYHRRSDGSGAWTLLLDNVSPGTPGIQTSARVMDQVALVTKYDFGVSALFSTGAESIISTVATGVSIDPSRGGAYSAMLHIQGQGSAYRAPLMLTGGPKPKAVLDSQQQPTFNLPSPVTRYGISDFRDVQIKAKLVDLPSDPLAATTFAQLQVVLARMKAGGVGVYRDSAGTMLTVGLKPDRTIAPLPQIYLGQREVDLNLVECPNQYAPSSTRGFASGMFTQINGSVAPLNPQEIAV